MGNTGVQFAVESEADAMSYFDLCSSRTHWNSSWRQMYVHNNRSRKCLAALQNMHVVKNGNQ